MKTIINFSDVHFPHQNDLAISCLLQTIKQLQPHIIRANGDIMDCGFCSRHDITKAPKKDWTDDQFLKASEKDFKIANKFFDLVHKYSPKSEIHYAMGNHEDWLSSFIDISPRTRQHFSLNNRLKFKERNIKSYPCNSFQRYGKLYVTHGLYTGQNHAKKHVDMAGSSILYGHLHDIQVHSKVTPQKETHMSWCTGCLCDLNPDYLKNRPQNWNHGFAIIYVYPNGNYQVDIKRITSGKVVIEGKVITGKSSWHS